MYVCVHAMYDVLCMLLLSIIDSSRAMALALEVW
jgi:hypothetical protein